MRPSRALPAGLVLAGAAVLTRAGCTPDPGPSGTTTRSPGTGSDPSSSASTSPSASAPASSPTASPVSIPCPTLVSNDTVYAFNPIYSAKSPFTPPSGSAAARVNRDGGTACEWINTSSGATIDVSVGRYTPAALAAIRAETFTGGTQTDGWGGDAGYFSTTKGGTATAFTGAYWVTARGEELGSADDAAPFMESAVAAAKAAG